MKHIYLPIVLAIALSSASCGHKSTDSSDDNLLSVDVAPALQDSVVIYRTYPGSLHAASSVDLVGRVSGYLRSQNYTGGDLVKAGQVLFTIESTQYADAVNQAQSQVASAESSLEYATSHYAAIKKALESDAVSRMEANQALSEVQSAEAQLKNARAALNTARTNLGYCTVRAPFTGHITSAEPSVGAYIDGEAQPVKLATIYQDDILNAKFFIDDKVLQEILTGNGAKKIGLDSIPLIFETPLEHAYAGKLTYVAPDVDTSTGTLTVQAKVDNPYDELHDGMYVQIRLPVSTDPKAVIVKDAALSTDQLGTFLYVVNDSDRVVYTPVKTGELVQGDSMRVITSGIKAGDRYITKALLKVRPEMKVKPVTVN